MKCDQHNFIVQIHPKQTSQVKLDWVRSLCFGNFRTFLLTSIMDFFTMLLVDAKGILCKSRKYPYPAQGKSMEIPRGRERVVSKAKVLKGIYEAEPDFSEDGWLQTIKNLP